MKLAAKRSIQRPPKISPEQSKRPRALIVSRLEKSEYTECQKCGDVFESCEWMDMAIAENKNPDDE